MPDSAALQQQFTPKPGKTLKAEPQLCSARYSPCAKLLVGGSYDGKIRLWDATTEDHVELPALPGHRGWVDDVQFAPAGGSFYSIDSWGRLTAWKYAGTTVSQMWTVEAAHDGWIQDLAVSADGARLATVGLDRAVRVWAAADGAKQAEFLEHPAEVLSVAFHPSGKELVSGDLHGHVRCWDLNTKTCQRTLDASALFKLDRLQDVGGVRKLAFDPSGARVVCAGTKPANGGNVQGTPAALIFDWASGELKLTLELGAVGDVYVSDLTFHAAGFLIVTMSGNPGQGKLVFRVPEETRSFYETTSMPNCHSVALHPNGKRLAIVGTNAGSNGNGRQLDKDGKYPDNHSPIWLLDFPA